MNHTNPTAKPLRRLAALLYDSLLVVAISMVYAAAALLLQVLIFGIDDSAQGPLVGGLWFQLGWLVTVVLFFCYFWHREGQTLGMRAWRLRLKNNTAVGGADLKHCAVNPSWAQCLRRCLFAPVSLAFMGIGYLWCYFDHRGDSLHDRLTNTQVIVLPKPAKKTVVKPGS